MNRYLTIGGAVVAVLAILAALATRVWPALPVRPWQAVALAASGVVALLVLVVAGLLIRRTRSKKAQPSEPVPARPAPEAEARAAMQRQLLKARDVVLRSPSLAGGKDPLYRVPWFLLLGDAESGQDALLRAASTTSPFPAPEKAPSGKEYWHWWFFKQMIAIETHPDLVCDASDKVMSAVWQQALQLLNRHRRLLPLNGLLALVSASALRGSSEQVRDYGLRLRRMIDEAMKGLGVHLPIYLIVTRCDALPGFPAFVGGLPKPVGSQVLGHLVEPYLPGRTISREEVERIFDDIRMRMHSMRLGLLRDQTDPLKRKGIFEFVESFAGLQPGLTTMVGVLVEDNPFQHTPRLRGLYFTGTQRDTAFVDDLFTRFMPRDQPLARRWHGASAPRGSTGRVAAAGLIGLPWLFTV